MSATLTWLEAGPYASNSGATAIGLMTDFKALMDANSADPDYLWEVVSSSLVTTPIYLTLARKDNSVGRILIIAWTSAPANNNSAILDGAPTATGIYMCWFPNGNVDTPSNLTAASGTVMGDDTNCVKASCITSPVATAYATAQRVSYVESNEAVFLLTQSSAGSQTVYGGGAGELLVDGSDNAYGAVLAPGIGTLSSLGAATNGNGMVWNATAPVLAGATTACIRTNQGAANRTLFFAWTPSANWTSQTLGSSLDPTTDATNGVTFLFGIPLLGQILPKSGTSIKLRQLAIGQVVGTPWQSINSSGPVRQALVLAPNTTATPGPGLWTTNFKI